MFLVGVLENVSPDLLGIRVEEGRVEKSMKSLYEGGRGNPAEDHKEVMNNKLC